MTDIRVIAIDFEAKVRSWSKRANGEIALGLIVHADDAHKVGPIEPGRRFQVAAVELDDNEQPTGRSEWSERQNNASVAKPAPGQPVQARAPNPYLARSHILAKNSDFWRYLSEYKKAYCPDENEAANWIREICNVESRKNIISGSEAATMFDLLESSYVAWKAQQ